MDGTQYCVCTLKGILLICIYRDDSYAAISLIQLGAQPSPSLKVSDEPSCRVSATKHIFDNNSKSCFVILYP
jgi:hypothetical protein